MAMTLDGSNGVTFNDASLQGAAASPYVLKNRLINSDMRIDQRNAGASVTNAATSVFSVDRWQVFGSQASKCTIQQNAGSVTPPTDFTNYVGITSSSAYSVTSTDQFVFFQPFEGYNMADLNWGTANAKTITLSFWVRSSLTGTFSAGIANYGATRSYVTTYTINAANTWEYKTITIAGDTSATWTASSSSSTTNGGWGYLNFNLGCGTNYNTTANTWATGNYKGVTGATSVVGTNGATFYITGVQLEQNTSATPFERRLYNQELANCQRYFITFGGDSTNQNFFITQAYSTTQFNGGALPFPVKMRTTPTFSYSALSDFYSQNSTSGAITPTAITQSGGEVSTMNGIIGGTVASGLSAGNASLFFAATANARLRFSAEL